MPKFDLVTRWDKAVDAFKSATEDEDFGPVYSKSLKIEYVEHEKLLRGIETALQLNKSDEAAKAMAVYDKASRALAATLLKIKAKQGSKDVTSAVKKLTDDIGALRDASRDLTGKNAKPEIAKKIDWKAVMTPETLAKMTRLSMESSAYKGFAADFAKLIKECGFGAGVATIPADIWKSLFLDAVKSIDFEKELGHVKEKPEDAIAAEMGKSFGKTICKDVAQSATKGLQPFSAHAARYMDKVITETQKGPKRVFWSGTGARAAAAKEGGGVILEETIGKWFDAMWDFGELNVRSNRDLWTGLSELYVKRAAQCYQRFRFIGFVGPGATSDQGVFNQLEKPSILTAMSAKATVPAPSVTWFVVDCDQEGAKWQWSKRPSIPVGSRSAALNEIKARYGG